MRPVGYLGPPIKEDTKGPTGPPIVVDYAPPHTWDKQPPGNAWGWWGHGWRKPPQPFIKPPVRWVPKPPTPVLLDNYGLPGYRQQLGCCDDLHGALADLGACPAGPTVIVEDAGGIPQWVWIVAAAWAALMLMKRGGR